MIIRLNAGNKEDLPFSFAMPCDKLDISSKGTIYLGNAIIEGKLIFLGGDYAAEGTVTVGKRFLCDRCLKEVEREVHIDFSEKFSREESDDSTLFMGDEIDLTEVVRDNILAAEPISHLCKEDCKGLCKICGKDLNEGECGCDRHIVDPRFSILQDYRIDD